jgi:hypothetical protein
MFGTGIVAKLRRKARAIDIMELSREMDALRAANQSQAAELYTLKAVVAVEIEARPEGRARLRQLLASGPLIDPSDPLSPGVRIAAEEWREMMTE